MKKKFLMGFVGLSLIVSFGGCAQSTANSALNAGSPFGAGVAIGQAIGKSLWGGK